ncbi:MAG: hypothetical protein QNK04_07865 [Myxococcota bacterium]|nr:hypothetical protein [Myxococcota bacterium]
MVRTVGAVLAAALLALGCSGGEQPEEAATGETVPIAGLYEVRGVTVAVESGHKREIAGTIILAEEGGHYTSTFNLTTTYPGAEEALPAEVIGKGDGTIEGRTLKGTAQTQLVMATVPGIDPGFAFVPRMVSTRIQSTTVATVSPDGTVNVQIENEPVAGEQYAPTRTTLNGRRVSAAGLENIAKAARERAQSEQ